MISCQSPEGSNYENESKGSIEFSRDNKIQESTVPQYYVPKKKDSVRIDAKKHYDDYKNLYLKGFIINNSSQSIKSLEITSTTFDESSVSENNIFVTRDKFRTQHLITDLDLKSGYKNSFEIRLPENTLTYWISFIKYADGTFDE